MEYMIANNYHLEEILKMKNLVKSRIIKEGLPIWKNGYPLDEIIIEDIEFHRGRVILLDGKVVAYASISHVGEEYGIDIFTNNNLATFGRVMVLDGYTGMHIGDLLVKSLIDEAKLFGEDGMGIAVDSCNIKAVNLYTKNGFKRVGEYQFPFAHLDLYEQYFN